MEWTWNHTPCWHPDVMISGVASDMMLPSVPPTLMHTCTFPCSFHICYYYSSVKCEMNIEMYMISGILLNLMVGQQHPLYDAMNVILWVITWCWTTREPAILAYIIMSRPWNLTCYFYIWQQPMEVQIGKRHGKFTYFVWPYNGCPQLCVHMHILVISSLKS